jgi:predicted membrane GTPase involved in stress response
MHEWDSRGWKQAVERALCGCRRCDILFCAAACSQTYLTPARQFTLEDAIGYVAGDELIEVTPGSIRLRKRMLDSSARKSQKRRAA